MITRIGTQIIRNFILSFNLPIGVAIKSAVRQYAPFQPMQSLDISIGNTDPSEKK